MLFIRRPEECETDSKNSVIFLFSIIVWTMKMQYIISDYTTVMLSSWYIQQEIGEKILINNGMLI